MHVFRHGDRHTVNLREGQPLPCTSLACRVAQWLPTESTPPRVSTRRSTNPPAGPPRATWPRGRRHKPKEISDLSEPGRRMCLPSESPENRTIVRAVRPEHRPEWLAFFQSLPWRAVRVFFFDPFVFRLQCGNPFQRLF